jgi:hypothetical protein
MKRKVLTAQTVVKIRPPSRGRRMHWDAVVHRSPFGRPRTALNPGLSLLGSVAESSSARSVAILESRY